MTARAEARPSLDTERYNIGTLRRRLGDRSYHTFATGGCFYLLCNAEYTKMLKTHLGFIPEVPQDGEIWLHLTSLDRSWEELVRIAPGKKIEIRRSGRTTIHTAVGPIQTTPEYRLVFEIRAGPDMDQAVALYAWSFEQCHALWRTALPK